MSDVKPPFAFAEGYTDSEKLERYEGTLLQIEGILSNEEWGDDFPDIILFMIHRAFADKPSEPTVVQLTKVDSDE